MKSITSFSFPFFSNQKATSEFINNGVISFGIFYVKKMPLGE